MPSFNSDGIDIAYLDEGHGDPILLIHGFASNKETNWVNPGWVSTLNAAGFRVIALDNRGHGASGKPTDPDVYPSSTMAEDARRLLDHLCIQRADVMGYSMGARITAFLAMTCPDRVRSAIFGGLGMGMIEGVGDPAPIVAALEAPSLKDVTTVRGRMFRAFAEQTGSNLAALAACMRSSRQTIDAAEIATIRVPVLVAVGTRDVISGSGADLAALIPGAVSEDIVDRDHMTAVGDKQYKQAVLRFLEHRP